MNPFKPGQRWFSPSEPELGLGIVASVESRLIEIIYPSSSEKRIYNIKSNPLKRLKLETGDQIKLTDGTQVKVDSILTEDDFFFFETSLGKYSESVIDIELDTSSVIDKIVNDQFEDNNLFDLRYNSYIHRRNYEKFKYKGLLGPKIRHIDHQAHIADVVSSRINPKVFLCDEVGLGKTIEAALVLNSMILKNKIESAIIVVPDSLVYQWYFELKFKFNLDFKPISNNDELGIEEESVNDHHHYIVSLSKLKEDKNLLSDIIDKSWDFLIVDEAHRIATEIELAIIDEISNLTKGTLFLSATPKANGDKSHFDKLEILEPGKFDSYDSYVQSQSKYAETLPIINKIINNDYTKADLQEILDASEIDVLNTKDKIISHLIDTHGTGRMIFRNTRDHLEKYNLFFPKRVLHSKKIENTNKLNDKLVFDLKFDYLKECLDQNSNEKVLVIVHSKDFAIKIHERLTSSTTIKSALFYSEQSLMERDRQAAYFADDDGARVLICTEVGSEGRNFEFASHLFLFDIPKVPDLLEQRIGRLDRVGQKHDINIHIPYIEKSFEHILIDWYEKVFKSFEAAPKAATTFYNEYKDKLEELIKSSFNQEDLDTFISNMKVKYDDLVIELSKGHDALLDINSFNFENAKAIKNSINEFNQKNDLDKYMNMAFDALGITIKDLSDKVFFIKESDNALLRGLPGLNSEGMSGTLSKDLASYRSDISLFSFEHPLIVNLVETLTNTEFGNLCIVKQNGAIKPDLCFELIFKLQTVASVGSVAREFLPLTPIRVLLDSQGKDITKDYSKKFVDSMIDSDIKNRAFMQNIPRESIKQLTDIGQNFAKARSKKYITDGIRALNETYELEKLRLKNLIKKNPLISDNEILAIDHLINENTKIINDASITLDAIRIVVKDGVV